MSDPLFYEIGVLLRPANSDSKPVQVDAARDLIMSTMRDAGFVAATVDRGPRYGEGKSPANAYMRFDDGLVFSASRRGDSILAGCICEERPTTLTEFTLDQLAQFIEALRVLERSVVS